MISLHEKILNNNRIWHWGALLLLLIYLLPLLMYGSKLQFLLFDNLDSNVVWFKILAESGKIFASSDTIIPNMLNGLPRSCYGSEFNTILWLYYFFTPIQAYVINELIIHSVAFISMYLFLDRYLFKEDNKYRHIYINIGALYFAMLPFWPSGGLSIPLMPLVTYALLKIEKGQGNWKAWILLILLPLYSNFVLVYFFYFLLAGIYFVRKLIITKKFNTKLFLALVLVVTLFLLTEYRVILQMFIEHSFVSNRTEYFSLVDNNFLDSYRNSHLQFINGVPHAKGTHLSFLLPAVLFTLFLTLLNKKLSIKNSLIFFTLFILTYALNIWQVLLTQIYTLPIIMLILIFFLFQNRNLLLSKLLFIQIIIAYWFGFSFYEGWQGTLDALPGLKIFNFSRFFFISQMLWGITVALMLKEVIKKINFSGYIIILFITLQTYSSSINGMFGTNIQFYHVPFYKYYATEQFDKIKKFIDKPQNSYKIINLGIEPAVTQYNGFYTLDGYMTNYPLQYKHEFRIIISKYLSTNKKYRDLYDGWGSKVYLFNPDANYVYPNEFFLKTYRGNSYSNLDANMTQVKHMGANYLFSLLKIADAEKYGLSFMKTFTDKNSMWSVSVYKVN